jgi:hypothetical protein
VQSGLGMGNLCIWRSRLPNLSGQVASNGKPAVFACLSWRSGAQTIPVRGRGPIPCRICDMESGRGVLEAGAPMRLRNGFRNERRAGGRRSDAVAEWVQEWTPCRRPAFRCG